MIREMINIGRKNHYRTKCDKRRKIIIELWYDKFNVRTYESVISIETLFTLDVDSYDSRL